MTFGNLSARTRAGPFASRRCLVRLREAQEDSARARSSVSLRTHSGISDLLQITRVLWRSKRKSSSVAERSTTGFPQCVSYRSSYRTFGFRPVRSATAPSPTGTAARCINDLARAVDTVSPHGPQHGTQCRSLNNVCEVPVEEAPEGHQHEADRKGLVVFQVRDARPLPSLAITATPSRSSPPSNAPTPEALHHGCGRRGTSAAIPRSPA